MTSRGGPKERRPATHRGASVAALDESDPNNIGEYRLSVNAREMQLVEAVRELASNLREGPVHHLKLSVILTEHHAYKPLLHADENCNITIQPVGLDDNEKTVVEGLAELAENGAACLRGRELFLIRNLPRGRGVSFFDDSAYYPDFIVWLKDGGRQDVVFLDPKGLARYGPRERDKVRLHDEIKGIEAQVRKTDPNLRLHAYVLSVTPPDQIGGESRPKSEWEQAGVYFLQDPDCLNNLIGDVLEAPPAD